MVSLQRGLVHHCSSKFTIIRITTVVWIPFAQPLYVCIPNPIFEVSVSTQMEALNPPPPPQTYEFIWDLMFYLHYSEFKVTFWISCQVAGVLHSTKMLVSSDHLHITSQRP
jgi:hypothetical protein